MEFDRRKWQRAVPCASLFVLLAAMARPASGQEHDHAHMTMAAGGWHVMQDAVLFVEFNRQGGDRGGTEFVAPNWWMGMADRQTSHGTVTLSSMFSLDPAAVGRKGYREIFQAGEALDGKPIVDRQHPHDFVMQLAASWRIPLSDRTGLTVTGAAAGEPALGPVAFMHRASSWDNPTAPLSHHTLDSTHVSFGVMTVGLDRDKWKGEASVFNGREPDDRRWNLDFGRFDSFSGRLWYRPKPDWELQVSSGRLKDPEALEPGNIVRSTASVSWTHQAAERTTSVTAAFGRNDTAHNARSAVLVEGARKSGLNTLYARFEGLQVETALLATHGIVDRDRTEATDPVLALTIGGARDVFRHLGLEGGFGADVTFYRVPDSLTSSYGSRPLSFHLFFRLRPSAGAMGRMWNMRMGEGMHR